MRGYEYSRNNDPDRGGLDHMNVLYSAAWNSAYAPSHRFTDTDGDLYRREGAEKGVVALVEATTSGFVEKGRFAPPDRSGKKSWPHPVIAGGRLYLRDQDVLLCYDVTAK